MTRSVARACVVFTSRSLLLSILSLVALPARADEPPPEPTAQTPAENDPAARAVTPPTPASPSPASEAPTAEAPALDATAAEPPAPPPEPEGYRALIDEAVNEYEARHFVEARALFSQANALYPNARALRGLGMAEFELRSYADAVHALGQALTSDVKPLDEALRAETERLRERARSFVATLTLTLSPSDAHVLVDGAPVALGPDGTLLLEVGAHAIEVRADGHATERLVRRYKGGESEQLRIALAPEGAPMAPLTLAGVAQPTRDEASKRPLYKSPWLWTGVGVGVAALATGLALGLASGGGGTRAPIALDPAGRIDGPR